MSTEIAVKTVANPAVVSITAHVPEDAMSAGLLGTERVGHGVRIRDDGLIATIGYVVHEAENLWIGSAETVVPGFVIGYDFDSGLALTGVDPLWRQLTTGALIIIAVSIDQWIRRVSS